MTEQQRDIKIKTINNKKYAYDMISYWDKTQKKYRKKSIYLGIITNPETKTYTPKKLSTTYKNQTPTTNELIQNFGDTYSILKTIENSPLNQILKTILPNNNDHTTLLSLTCHKIIKSSAMQHVENWSKGNIISTIYPDTNLSSQRISDFLKTLGKETLWRNFFKQYIEQITQEKVGVIIDSTGLPNEVDFPFSAWSNHGDGSARETRFLMVIDRISGNPLYFRYMAGNIVDVSTLAHTFAELKQMGVKTFFALIDAGYFSESNIRELYENKISFLTRLPSGRVLYKLLIEQHLDVESVENVVVYGKRVLYVKCVSVDLFGYEGFAYVVCDIKRKGDETARFFIAAKEDKLGSDVVGESLKGKGKFVLVSSEKISVEDVIPLYYTRQFAENLFGVSKSFLDFLPIRTHNIETLRGYLMLTFIALIIHLEMKRCLSDKFTVEEALTEMANLMAKTYGETTIVCEPTKNMKNIASLLGYMVPMKLGV